MNRTPENGLSALGETRVVWLRDRQPLVDQLFAASGALSWGLQRTAFASVLERSARKRFAEQPPPSIELEKYLSALHLQDLALACACAEGCPGAWDFFVSTFRPYLRSAAAAILRCPPDSPASRELADSLFADLYGLGEGANRRSLFRYFHGRSSLKTWLRAVLAQRHIDTLRASRRFTDLEGADPHVAPEASLTASSPRPGPSIEPPNDPHRGELVAVVRRTLEVALGLLDPRDKERLRLYYAADQTLAEIGRKLGEHESSVSRHLDRIRRELRLQVEQALRKSGAQVDGPLPHDGLSDAQIALCFQYAAEDAPIDLDKLLPETPATGSKPESKKL